MEKAEFIPLFLFQSNKHKYSDKFFICIEFKNQIVYNMKKRKKVENMSGIKLNLKNSSYNTILEVTSKSDAIGLITKEYVEKEKLEKYNLVELKTELELKPIEFGIYVNLERKKEVDFLIKIVEKNLI